jgi:hypothetical protein
MTTTKNLRTVFNSLIAQEDRGHEGRAFIHPNTQRALERRGLAVKLGLGHWGVTTLGRQAVGR